MATVSPRAQRLLQQLRRTLTRYTEQGRDQPEQNSAKAHRALGVRIGRLIQRLRLSLHLTPTHFARRLRVTPQTVRRWETHQVIPRLSQLERFEILLQQKQGQDRASNQMPDGSSFSNIAESRSPMASDMRPGVGVVGMGLAGIGLADQINRVLERAQAVWIFQSQRLGESEYGYRAEVVLKSLQRGVHFHYVYPAGSAADRSFQSSLQPWLRAESFTGSVTGYVIQRPQLAYQLGLADAPVTWMAVESASTVSPTGPADRPSTVPSLQLVTGPDRRWAVLVQLRARDYRDSEHQFEKSEAGQEYWIELPAPQATAWLDKLTRLQNMKAVMAQGAPAAGKIRTIVV